MSIIIRTCVLFLRSIPAQNYLLQMHQIADIVLRVVFQREHEKRVIANKGFYPQMKYYLEILEFSIFEFLSTTLLT